MWPKQFGNQFWSPVKEHLRKEREFSTDEDEAREPIRAEPDRAQTSQLETTQIKTRSSRVEAPVVQQGMRYFTYKALDR